MSYKIYNYIAPEHTLTITPETIGGFVVLSVVVVGVIIYLYVRKRQNANKPDYK